MVSAIVKFLYVLSLDNFITVNKKLNFIWFNQLIGSMIEFAGSDQRQDDLFSNESLLSMGRNVFKGLKVYIIYNCLR